MTLLNRSLAASLGVTLAAASAAPALAQQGLGFQQGSMPAPTGAPLDLLSPTFMAPRLVPAPAGRPAEAAPAPAVPPVATAVMTAPLPLPRPASAPRVVITEASAPPPVAAAMVMPAPAAALQTAPAVLPQTAPSAAASVADDWPHEEARDSVIRPWSQALRPSQPVAAVQEAAAPAAATPEPPAQALGFAAPVPLPRPDAGNVTVVAAAPASGPQLASVGSAPVVLNQAGSATTTVVPAPPPGAPAGMAPAVIAAPEPPRGPILVALPPEGGRDWPRFVPGAQGQDRNTGIAGDRVIPDPGVPLSCLPAPVRRALNDVALRFGPILVRSTHRGNGTFVRMDAWRGSYHKDCRAADFRISGNGAAVLAFLRQRPDLGGVKRYRNGLIHIDDGPRRSW